MFSIPGFIASSLLYPAARTHRPAFHPPAAPSISEKSDPCAVLAASVLRAEAISSAHAWKLNQNPKGKKTMATNESQSSTLLAPGAKAPDFTLNFAPTQPFSLSSLRGKPVILAFYPADWSPTCGDQIGLYNEILPEFRKFGAELLGISVDGPWCHKAYTEQRNLHFKLLSDFEPKGAVSRQYGAYRTADGMSERALFVIDANGVIAWSYLSPIRVNPGADGILEALEKLPAEKLPKSA
jgi:peroxiredoxin